MTPITESTSLYGGFGGWGHITGGMTGYGWIVMVLFWFLIVWVIWSFTSDRRAAPRSPVDALDDRYAQREIHQDHYLESKADLRQ